MSVQFPHGVSLKVVYPFEFHKIEHMLDFYPGVGGYWPRQEVADWLNAHVGDYEIMWTLDKKYWGYGSGGNFDLVTFAFKDAKHAALFKIRWF